CADRRTLISLAATSTVAHGWPGKLLTGCEHGGRVLRIRRREGVPIRIALRFLTMSVEAATVLAVPAPTMELRRQLGLGSATAAVVGEIIGIGIFLTPA